MEGIQIIDLTPENISAYGVCGYKDVKKQVELRHKIDWFSEYYNKGLRIKAVILEKGGYQGMIEYIPGRFAHRPVDAEDYMFIHCLFVGFRNEYKGRGLASALLDECIKDAKEKEMLGVAVVTRKGSFMADNRIFLKKGFQIADHCSPDFDLLVRKFDGKGKNPGFKSNMNENLKKYNKGLTILRSFQCPYTEKNVNAILQTARKLEIECRLINLNDAISAQENPSPFGTFCIIYEGEIISHHPISNTRFENIMNKKLQ
ncbi:MAG: GNAT family N-acetyltransferase [Bacteroidales bacterium]|nr:GNAT family N-acetyltransferase [Bacteroidales bacterium]